MTISTTRMAYADIFEIYEKAMDDPKGVRIPFNTRGDAVYYRMRLHTARTIDRNDNIKLYAKGDPLYGQSKYDVLQVRILHGVAMPEEDIVECWFVYIEPRDKGVGEIESLSEVEGDQT